MCVDSMDKELRVREGGVLPHFPEPLEKLRLRAGGKLSGCPSRTVLPAQPCVAEPAPTEVLGLGHSPMKLNPKVIHSSPKPRNKSNGKSV